MQSKFMHFDSDTSLEIKVLAHRNELDMSLKRFATA